MLNIYLTLFLHLPKKQISYLFVNVHYFRLDKVILYLLKQKQTCLLLTPPRPPLLIFPRCPPFGFLKMSCYFIHSIVIYKDKNACLQNTHLREECWNI